MLKLIITIIVILHQMGYVHAQSISASKVTACEAEWRAKGKAEKAAAPKGYKPDRPKGAKAEFMSGCLSK